MTSDRARISWDRTRQWRSVVAQQGRVTVEADVNEASTIAQEARREEVLDIVGPSGTPDNGYAVSDAGGGAIALSPGALYLGGWRLALEKPLVSTAQPDWLDAPQYAPKDGSEVVLLRAYEQEVTAVEDQALREVALGGPDTAARTRLLQHVIRARVEATDCASAAQEIGKRLAEEGLSLDAHSLELLSTARLQVGFVPPNPLPGPCDPPAQGGYLGADNQLIRVTVTDFDPDTGKGKLLWGWNNASFLYRAKTVAANMLVLAADPLDAEHTPRVGQPVEVLRTRVALGGPDYIAAPEGEIRVLGAPYTPQNRTLTLPSALPSAYVNDPNGPLFVRLWEAQADFISGQPALLDPSGLQVTITMTGWSKVTGRPFWTFAVRPSTPIDVYPARYAQTPQPPEGARQWLAELAVIGWKNGAFQLLEDCRHPFLPLTEQKNDGCCALVLEPDQLTAGHTLQHVIDKAVENGHATISLRPGVYMLDEPLRLGPQHKGLVLEGCRDGAVLQARPGAEDAFATGLIILQRANEVVLRDLRIEMPLAPWRFAARKNEASGLFVSVGVMAVHCAALGIEDCLFRYHVPKGENLVAVGVYARSECWGLKLRGNRFLRDEDYQRDDGVERFLFGYALTPDTSQTVHLSPRFKRIEATAAPDAWLDDARIQDNRFDGLTLPVLVMAGLGHIDCFDNEVRNCDGGFCFLSSDLGATLELFRQIQGYDDKALIRAFTECLNGDLIDLAAELGEAIPRPAPLDGEKPVKTPSQKALGLQANAFREAAAKAMRTFADTRLASADKARSATDKTKASTDETLASIALGAPKDTGSTTEDRRGGNLAQAYRIALAARLIGVDSRPVLRIRGNTLETTGHPLRSDPGSSRRGAAASKKEAKIRNIEAEVQTLKLRNDERMSGLAAINAVFEYREDQAQIMVQNNRVMLETQAASAVAVLLPSLAVATGNLLVQPSDPIHTRADCFVMIGDVERSRLDVMGNLIRGGVVIRPNRTTGLDPNSWEFLNTIG